MQFYLLQTGGRELLFFHYPVILSCLCIGGFCVIPKHALSLFPIPDLITGFKLGFLCTQYNFLSHVVNLLWRRLMCSMSPCTDKRPCLGLMSWKRCVWFPTQTVIVGELYLWKQCEAIWLVYLVHHRNSEYIAWMTCLLHVADSAFE